MLLDWHITCLGYCSHTVNIKAVGEKEFRKSGITFYAPFQYPKEIHKNTKMLEVDFIEKFLYNGAENRKISLADIFIFSELMTLNLIGHNLGKYPNVVLYLKRLASEFPGLKSSLNSVEAYVRLNGKDFYLGEAGFGEVGAKL